THPLPPPRFDLRACDLAQWTTSEFSGPGQHPIALCPDRLQQRTLPLQVHLREIFERHAAQLAVRREVAILQHLGHTQAEYPLGYLLIIRPHSLPDASPVHREANAP